MNSNIIKMAMIVVLQFCIAGTVFAANNAKLKEISKLSEQGKQEDALEKVNDYLERKPKDAEAMFMKGVILVELGQRDNAITAFNHLTKQYPNLPEPYNNLAVLYADKGQYDKARQSLESAIKTHPSYATAHENLGDIYARLASDAYSKAFKLDTSNARAQNKLAMITDLFGGSAVFKAPANNNKPTVIAKADTTAPASKVTEKPKKLTKSKDDDKPKAIKKVEPTTTEKPKEIKKAEPVSKPKPKTASGGSKDDVLAAVNNWAAAWSKQNVKGYLASYAPSFKPAKGGSRSDWEAKRRKRVKAPSSISVKVGRPKVTMQDDKSAKVVFYQTYQAGGRQAMSTHKTLKMVKRGGDWLINRELIGRH